MWRRTPLISRSGIDVRQASSCALARETGMTSAAASTARPRSVMFFADSMTIYSTTLLRSQNQYSFDGCYFRRCAARDKRGDGNDIHDRRVWNRCAAYAGPVPPDALTGECKHSTGEYAFIE